MEACEQQHQQKTGQYPQCLSVSGSKLVSGSIVYDDYVQREVRVWGLEELELQQTLPRPPGSDVDARGEVDGEGWGDVGRDVVVWGRQA